MWDAEVGPLLKTGARLSAVTLLEELKRRHLRQYDSGVLRTLQRRMRQWRALHGTEHSAYCAQKHPPRRLGLLDCTVCNALGVEIDGTPVAHRRYPFALAQSG
jgi:hypothetical protein